MHTLQPPWPLTGVIRALRARKPQKVEKKFPGPRGQKRLKKSRKKVKKELKTTLFRLFQPFFSLFDPGAERPRELFFDFFLGFRARRARMTPVRGQGGCNAYMKNAEHHQFESDTDASPLSQNVSCKRYGYTYMKHFLVAVFKFNASTYTSKTRRDSLFTRERRNSDRGLSFWWAQEWFQQTKLKKVTSANFRGRSPELVPEPPFAYDAVQNPLKRGVPELILDSPPESSWTSLSSVWFAGTTDSLSLGCFWDRGRHGSRLP